MLRTARIYVAGGRTLLGAALINRLRAAGHDRLVGLPPDEPDLTDAAQVDDFFATVRPEYVFVAAGASGGIRANQARPAELMRDNLLIAAHVLHSAERHGVSKLLYLASSCAYPRSAPQPLREESLLSGPLEPSSEAYALAKLAGIKLAQAYRRQYGARFLSAVPADVFGPHDDFHPEHAHVIPALIRRLHEAKQRGDPEFTVWGTGTPRREFVFSHDLADACLFVMNRYDGAEPINLGGGMEMSIAEAARIVAEVVGYRGRLRFDPSKPDGTPRKVLDSSRLRALGWNRVSDFRAGLIETYKWFLHHRATKDFCDAPAAV
ncbi:MAG TPA: GDP-L-fucose synthase [Gemmataceae bacterium]|nr:GDP-L-fucose synthase [Gemmataceae bacterium]